MMLFLQQSDQMFFRSLGCNNKRNNSNRTRAMLSRLAESSFWLGRYLERAEGMSRLLIEFHQLLIQDSRTHVKRGCTLISHGLGLEGAAAGAPVGGGTAAQQDPAGRG